MTITRSELLDVVHQHYPRGMLQIHRMHVPPGELVYDDTEEHCRLITAAARGRREYATWNAMIDGLEDRYSVQNESLHLLAGGIDPAYSGRVWLILGKTSINFHVSLLGPYYGIQLPGVPEEEPVAHEIARAIEAAYPGYQTIPPDLGNEVVPDVTAGRDFGSATIYTCLFSEVWTRVYKDLPSPAPEPPSTFTGFLAFQRFVDDVDAALESRYPKLHEKVTKLRQLLPRGTISIEFAMPRRRKRTD